MTICAGLLIFSTFMAVQFKDYLKSNDQGICWPEGRKLPIEEIRIRALKTYILKHKIEFDHENHSLGQEISYWRIIKQDYNEDTAFKLSLTFPLPATTHTDVQKQIFDPILKVEDFEQNLLYNDDFYKNIIKNNYMLVASYNSGLNGIILRTSSYKLHKHSELNQITTPPSNAMDRMQGFGSYYFSIQGINIDYWHYEKRKSINIGNMTYAINNCGNSLHLVNGNSREINKTTEK